MSDAAQPTAADVRAACEAVKDALDRHLAAVERRTEWADRVAETGGSDADAAAHDAEVFTAFDQLAAAGEAYDALLYEVHDEVTPFEIPSGDSLPTYAGPEEPHALTVLIRRDYTVSNARRLIDQAERVSELDPEHVDEESAGSAGGNSVHAALSVLFGEYEADEIASRHKEFGLEEGDSTLWVTSADEPGEPGEWLSAPFDQADPERVICRFDVSSAFDDEELELERDLDRQGPGYGGTGR